MDRNIIYPGSIPLDTDLLSTNLNAMVGLGYLAQAVLGQSTIADGLVCGPTAPASLAVTVGPGSLTQLTTVDILSYGSLPADTVDPLVKIGVNISSTSFALVTPTTSGQSTDYLIQASFLESDVSPVVLPYYNAANPAQPYSGPANSGVPQNTQRIQRVQLELKAGAPALTGQQQTPQVDAGWVGLYTISVNYGQVEILAANIALSPSAPFLTWKLPQLRPGFASGVQTFPTSGVFTVPLGVTQAEVELWGGGLRLICVDQWYAERGRRWRRVLPLADCEPFAWPSSSSDRWPRRKWRNHCGRWSDSGGYFGVWLLCQRHRR